MHLPAFLHLAGVGQLAQGLNCLIGIDFLVAIIYLFWQFLLLV
jgi:hypothetical protein